MNPTDPKSNFSALWHRYLTILVSLAVRMTIMVTRCMFPCHRRHCARQPQQFVSPRNRHFRQHHHHLRNYSHPHLHGIPSHHLYDQLRQYRPPRPTKNHHHCNRHHHPQSSATPISSYLSRTLHASPVSSSFFS